MNDLFLSEPHSHPLLLGNEHNTYSLNNSNVLADPSPPLSLHAPTDEVWVRRLQTEKKQSAHPDSKAIALESSSASIQNISSDSLVGTSSGVSLPDDGLRIQARGIRIRVRGRGERVNGTNDDDTLDARPGRGNNRLFGRRGNDTLFARKNDQLFGEVGNDRLFANRRGRGRNLLDGGKGNDELFGLRRDTLKGGAGKDTLDTSKKGRGRNELDGGRGNDILIGGTNDTLIGGRGRDEFWVANRNLPRKAHTINDFALGKDVIHFQRVAGVDQLSDLSLTQDGNDTTISANGKTIVVVKNIQATALDNIDNFSGIEAGPPRISIADASVLEGNTGTTNLAFTVSLNNTSTETVTVDYAIAANTANPGIDYTVASTTGNLTFAPGTQTRTIMVNVRGDILGENNETLSVTLSNPINASLSDAQATGTILDDEENGTTRPGNQYSGAAQNQQDILSQFNLYTVDSNGLEILDQAPNDNNVGVFIGAVEDFRTAQGELLVDGDGNVIVDNDGEVIINPDIPFILSDTLFEVGNLEARFVANNPVFGNRDVIEYTFYSGSGASRIDFKTVVLDYQDADDFNDFPDVLLPNNFDVNQAINSLDYIFANNLLGITEFLSEDGTSSGAPDIILKERVQEPFEEVVGGAQQGNRYSATGQNQTNIEVQFDLFDKTTEGTLIEDSEGIETTGIFIGAIRNYTRGSGVVNTTGEDTFTPDTVQFSVGNLEAQLIENNPDFRGDDVIQYTIFTQDGNVRTDFLSGVLDFLDPDGFGLFPEVDLP